MSARPAKFPAPKPPPNRLFYGDNLEILRGKDQRGRPYLADESVDLVYLDPPFNSARDYNVLFAEHSGERAAAQIKAFEDTWRWDRSAQEAFADGLAAGGRTADVLSGLKGMLGASDMMAYLAMMAPRLVELRRALEPTGSIYLHCDPTASHYLKVLMDGIFGSRNFRNEIVWRRSHPKGLASIRFARNHDVILSYAKDLQAAKWRPPYKPHDAARARRQYTLEDDDGRRYQLTSLLNPNSDRPNLKYEFKGVVKVWRWTRDRMLEEERNGRIVVPRDGAGVPRYKRYLDEQKGIPIGDFWEDIEIATGEERLGYPTQKPEALLERIVAASTDEGDVVLDPFCGCGTAVAVAQRMKRRWIGIDVTHLAIGLVKHRLRDSFGGRVRYETLGEPAGLPDARALALEDRFQFQWWALGLAGARPAEQTKGADRGIDGRIYFQDEARGKPRQVVFSVKSGKVGPRDVRDLRGVVEREEAAIGVLLTLEEPTPQMRADAATGGFYRSPGFPRRYPRVQILSIEDLLAGKEVEMPSRNVAANVTFRRAPKADDREATDDLFDEESEPDEDA